MTRPMRLSLRAGEKVYINGAVLQVDRKTSIELLNDATFLLQNHVLQPSDANTPLRQLYFFAQTMLMEPDGAEDARALFEESHALLLKTFLHEDVLGGLGEVSELMRGGRILEAMKRIRALFDLEQSILASRSTAAA